MAINSMKPACMTRGAPKRATRPPVKNDGANMPNTCHWITGLTSSVAKPQPSMASGVAVMAMIITT